MNVLLRLVKYGMKQGAKTKMKSMLLQYKDLFGNLVVKVERLLRLSKSQSCRAA